MSLDTDKIPLIVVLGPTASGKTALAVELAKEFNGEIVSADSMQVYRAMSIGTAKPSLEERQKIPHHLIDIAALSDVFSVADYASLAHRAIADIQDRGKIPILAGGTGLYLDAVTKDIRFEETPKDESLREQLTQMARANPEGLFSILQKLDPQEAQRIDRYNPIRLVRAVEVCRLTGGTMTEYKRRNTAYPSRYQCLKIGISYEPREILYQRIGQRVDQMMEQGLLDEARQVLQEDVLGTASQAIGYKEFLPFFAGESTLSEVCAKIKQETRRYAKRQMTWFRRDPAIQWFFKGTSPREEIFKKNIWICMEKFMELCYDK